MKMLRLPLLITVFAFTAGCAAPFAPSISPVPAPNVKPGRQYEALVVLPDKSLASVNLHYAYISGRLTITGVALVNHDPEKVTLFFSQTKIYIGENEILPIARVREMEPHTKPIDLKIMRPMPPGAEGKWIIPKRKFFTSKTLGTPVIVIFYSAHGRDGFVKIRYTPIWDITG